jgi:hypothetical protein
MMTGAAEVDLEAFRWSGRPKSLKIAVGEG